MKDIKTVNPKGQYNQKLIQIRANGELLDINKITFWISKN